MLNYIKSLIAPVLASLFIVGASQAALYQWSKTPASNSNADPTINWAEGMSPSSVNDSARAMMARVAEWRDDTSGLLNTTGTASAYLLTTNQGIPNPPTHGQLLAFRPNANNASGVTLAVDGGTAYPITTTASLASGVPAGTLINNAPYTVMYDSSDEVWIVRNYYGSTVTDFLVPIGGLIPFAGTAAPNSNFVFAYGQCISRTTYANLFKIISTTYGSCDGTTTFGLPDVRGRVVAGKDDMGGSSANRLTNQSGGVNGDVLGDTGGAETHTLTLAQTPAHTHAQTAQNPTFTYNRRNDISTGGSTTVVTEITASSDPFSVTTASDGSPGSTGSAGSGSAHNNVQPTIIFNMLIRIQ